MGVYIINPTMEVRKNIMKYISTVLGASTLLFGSLVHAAIINPGASIVQANHSNFINDLEWLDLDVTDGMSVNDALTANVGFRVATESEFHAMFSIFGVGGDDKFLGNTVSSWAHGSNGSDRFVGDLYAFDPAVDNEFSAVFGVSISFNETSQILRYSYGLYEDAGSVLRLGGVIDARYSRRADTSVEFYDNSINYSRSRTSSHKAISTFLVRKSVPEPSTVALMGFGIFALGVARRRNRARV